LQLEYRCWWLYIFCQCWLISVLSPYLSGLHLFITNELILYFNVQHVLHKTYEIIHIGTNYLGFKVCNISPNFEIFVLFCIFYINKYYYEQENHDHNINKYLFSIYVTFWLIVKKIYIFITTKDIFNIAKYKFYYTIQNIINWKWEKINVGEIFNYFTRKKQK